MIKIDNNSNKLIISHISDVDGMGSIILSKLIENRDILLISVEEVREILTNLLNENKYEEILICDLSIPDDLADIINNRLPLKHFDHHQTNTYVSKYVWSTVIVEEDGIKPCGTSLYYNYLIKNNLIKKASKLDKFVEAVRSNDVWDLNSKEIILGKKLTMLLPIYGVLKFIETIYTILLNNSDFELGELENNILNIEEARMKDYIELSNQNLIIADFMNYKIGISISESYRSELGNSLSKIHPELDFILIVDFMRRSFSMRTTKEINLGEISKQLGGGGHTKAAGFPMNKENLDKILDIIKNNINK